MHDNIDILISIYLNTIGITTIFIMNCKRNEKNKRIACILVSGMVIGCFSALLISFSPFLFNMIHYGLLGMAITESLYIMYSVMKSRLFAEVSKDISCLSYDDGTPPKYYITGDKHRDFDRVKRFCNLNKTTKKDVLIILGDSGCNYYLDNRDAELKSELSALNITLFCIYGNKECRPENITAYGIRNFCEGKVLYEPRYPNILFAIDGEIYTFDGKKYMVIGGAHSVDKLYCIGEHQPYWADEMPDEQKKRKVEERLASEHNEVYGFLTHTCPIEYLPTEVFLSNQGSVEKKEKQLKKRKTCLRKRPNTAYDLDIDRSTEQWLSELMKKTKHCVWFCGHYHVDKDIDHVFMMYQQIRPLHLN